MDKKLEYREAPSFALGTAKEEERYPGPPGSKPHIQQVPRHVLNTDYMQMGDEQMSEKAPVSKDPTA